MYENKRVDLRAYDQAFLTRQLKFLQSDRDCVVINLSLAFVLAVESSDTVRAERSVIDASRQAGCTLLLGCAPTGSILISSSL